ncbi:MAG: D-alanine--D-alanine ligase family protein [Peptoniphilus sp.]|nr:D-alanine--D-alanine ligase family protein [Peptoniphilus sp.]MDD7363802.1 D-alanine--D-alanine ligase [Bacillota bacterium]MDY6044643.1 D-alanine--D-alanine ligase family protein [Peptoniphilus sp.]
MKTIAVFFGGRSVEHEVSVITGMQVIENLDKKAYDAVPVYVTKDGQFLGGEKLKNFKTFKSGDLSETFPVYFKPDADDRALYRKEEEKGGLFSKGGEKEVVYADVDMVFTALHGTFGEDGGIQGYFDTMNIPYIGCSTVSAAVGMDKKIMKDVFKSHGIPVLEGEAFYRREWEEDKETIRRAAEAIGYPVFVKPSNLGSSIGISKVNDPSELDEAMELACRYDRKVLVEKAAENPREINCAVLGYAGDVETSALEEPLGWKELLSFEDKYVSGNKKTGSKEGNARNCPAKVDDALREEIETLAKKAFTAIDACGTARIDFLVTESGTFVNEINTLPGSMGFYLWEPKGISFSELLDRVIALGEIRAEERGRTMYSYESNLFSKTGYGSKL